MSLLRRQLNSEVRILDERGGLVEYVASDESVDSYREVIRADGWRFTNFKKNAPFVDSHDYSSIEKLLGSVKDFAVHKGRLVETVQWAVEADSNRLAQIGWQMTRAGHLKAVSVGFLPIRLLTPNDGADYLKQLQQLGLPADAGVRTIYLEQEQLELSAVIIGANPNALANARADGLLTELDCEMLRQRGARLPEPGPCRSYSFPTGPAFVRAVKRMAATLPAESTKTVANPRPIYELLRSISH